MTESELYKSVRAACGKLPPENTDDIENTDILEASNWILEKINCSIPETTLRYVTSEANEREYSVPIEVMRVKKVYQWDTIDTDLMILGGIEVAEGERNEYYNHPSMWTIEKMRRKRARPPIRFRFSPRKRKLEIDPAPEETGLKYWYLSADKNQFTLANLPADFNELAVVGVAWKALEIVALRRSDLGGVVRESGFVTYPSTELKRFSDDKRDYFFSELKIKAMVNW